MTDRPVCVTGASGFVGSQIVRELLEHGYRVRGTVRSPTRSLDEGHLPALPGAAERLELVAADLHQPGSFDEAIAGCGYVIHTASPYVLSVADPQRDLVDPAIEGTKTVLQSVLRAGDVRRVVITSSFAAMTDEPAGTMSEKDWNTKSSLSRNPYYYSKVMAERAAWEMAGAQPGLDLVSVNPSVVIGPSLVPSLNTSNGTLVSTTNGTFPGILSLSFGLVDVRDVAAAHRLAFETGSAQGRYLCTADVWTMRQVVEAAKVAGLGVRRLASLPFDNPFGTALAKLAARLQPAGNRDYLLTNLGRHWQVDTTKVRTELGLVFRSVAETVVDAFADLIRWGHIEVR
ncbi:MAG: NAD-dependent epimerase/dehydratase family protein [Actinomycetota bacterium]